MVNVLSGKDWIPKWEAKVVMATVTKAQTLNSNKMDLVLPQLTPVQAAWAGEEKTLWSCHYIRWLRERQSDATPRVQISYFFSSHDNIHHVRIQWNNNPLLHHSSSRDGSQKRKASVTADHSGANKQWMNQRNLMRASIRNHRVYLYIRDIINISKFNTCQKGKVALQVNKKNI